MEKIRILKSFKDKSLGVAFRNDFGPVFFKTRWGIHTFFVRKPLDVFILDEGMRLIKIKRGLKPWRLFLWNPIYTNVIEAPSEINLFINLKIGDRIKNIH